MTRTLRILVLGTLLLTMATAAHAQYGFDWEPGKTGGVAGDLELVVFHSDIINTGAVTDSFRVVMTRDTPPDWVISMCEYDFCYAPFVTEFTFTLAPGDTNDVGVNITPLIDTGTARVTLTVTSLNDPAATGANTFTLVSEELDILVVDADPAGDPVPWAAAALAGVGKSAGAWVRADAGSPDPLDLSAFEAVVWSAGAGVPGLSADDRAALTSYVQAGGHLYLNGANLAFANCSPGYPGSTPESHAWFTDVLGVDFVAISSGLFDVTGIAGDELGDGLAVGLNGGDSAGNNTSPDLIAASGGGTAAFAYAPGQTAGVRRAYGAGKIVTTAFTFEGVETAAERGDLMAGILGWFSGGLSGVGDPVPAVLADGARAVPNPFNPRTSLVFELGGTRAVPVAVTVHDLRGRAVRTLFHGAMEPGRRTLPWNGRDDAGRSLAAGVYLARISAGEAERTVKMTLAK